MSIRKGNCVVYEISVTKELFILIMYNENKMSTSLETFWKWNILKIFVTNKSPLQLMI